MTGRSAWAAMALGIVFVAVTACSTAAPSVAPASGNAGASVDPSASPRPTAAPSSRPTPQGSPVASPTPAPTEAPEPTDEPAPPVEPPPDGSLIVDWDVADVRGLERLTGIRGDAASGETWLIAGETDVVTPEGDLNQVGGIWRSDAGGTWQQVLELEDGWVSDIATGGPGFVAVGSNGDRAAVWLSGDGRTWRSVEDDAFGDGRMFHVGVSDSGIVAFGEAGDGEDGVIWTSPDGSSWLKATNASGLEVAAGLQALLADDGRLTAFVGDGTGPMTSRSGRRRGAPNGARSARCPTRSEPPSPQRPTDREGGSPSAARMASVLVWAGGPTMASPGSAWRALRTQRRR